MTFAVVHLSDIHFGQEKGGIRYIHNDVKEQVISDISSFLLTMTAGRAGGVVVSGDIAYAGKESEYKDAGQWLDRVAQAAGCEITDIQVVPGNHDIDRDRISSATEWLLNEISKYGDEKLDSTLDSELDRQLLYERFLAYAPFASGYNCHLDRDGGVAGDRKVQIAPGKWLRFIGLNSALVCNKKDAPGSLLLGCKQRVVPENDKEEVIVVVHHPLRWFKDSTEAQGYIRPRVRMLITGHEHSPCLDLSPSDDDCQLLSLAAGAVVPPEATGGFTYSYNIIEFDYEEATDDLLVSVHHRTWSEVKKRFVRDAAHETEHPNPIRLKCPHFHTKTAAATDAPSEPGKDNLPVLFEEGLELETTVAEVLKTFPSLRLQFFRDFTDAERVAILVRLGVIPQNVPQPLRLGMEQVIFESLKRGDRLEELSNSMNEVVGLRKREQE